MNKCWVILILISQPKTSLSLLTHQKFVSRIFLKKSNLILFVDYFAIILAQILLKN